MSNLTRGALAGLTPFEELKPGEEVTPEPITVAARPVALGSSDPDLIQAGAMIYRGGLSLTSETEVFGGFSGILVSPDERQLRAVSDEGYFLSLAMQYDDAGRLTGVADASMVLLAGLEGKDPMRWADAEELTPHDDGGFLVSFEHEHRIWHYAHPRAEPITIPEPADIANSRANNGIEAMTRLADGRLLAISEGLHQGDGVVAWIGDANGGNWQALTYVIFHGYKPTGAATLPNGDVIVVERRFPPLAARVRRIPAADIRPGAVITAEDVARFEDGFAIDNMEGIDARLTPEGKTLIYMMSDNHFRDVQKTLLLMFELP
jgi:hypothetical protein